MFVSHRLKLTSLLEWRSAGRIALCGSRLRCLPSEIPLVSSNGREKFILDLRKSRVAFSKGTYQTRGREVVVLVRLDYGGAPHRNPDGSEIGSPHLHHYQEGFADKWAKPLPEDLFADREKDRWFKDLMRYCNIVPPPIIQQNLFK